MGHTSALLPAGAEAVHVCCGRRVVTLAGLLASAEAVLGVLRIPLHIRPPPACSGVSQCKTRVARVVLAVNFAAPYAPWSDAKSPRLDTALLDTTRQTCGRIRQPHVSTASNYPAMHVSTASDYPAMRVSTASDYPAGHVQGVTCGGAPAPAAAAAATGAPLQHSIHVQLPLVPAAAHDTCSSSAPLAVHSPSGTAPVPENM